MKESNSSSSSSESDSDSPRNCITGKKIKMTLNKSAQDIANDIRRTVLRHAMNSQI